MTGFLRDNDKILIIRRSTKDDFLPGYYELPGGKVEFGEDPAEAVKREFKEETGLDVKVMKPIYVFHFFRTKDMHVVDITFMVERADTLDKVVLSHDHDDYKWIRVDEIGDLKISDNMARCIRYCFREIKTNTS